MATQDGRKFLFVSSANLSTNPRTLKEIRLALALGHEATFVGFKMGNWSDANDEQIRKDLPGLKCIYFDATRSSFLVWLSDSIAERLARFIWPLAKNNMFLSSLAHSKRTMRLLSLGKKVATGEYDFVIGHTLSAFYPSYKIAKKIKARLGFDVEDYHPGEKIEPAINNEKERREILMQKVILQADYITSASDLITVEVNKLVAGVRDKNHSVLNYFSKTEFTVPIIANEEEKLKLVWFSQNISAGRGLEILLSAWGTLNDKFTFTLIGKLDEGFYENHLKFLQGITILPAMRQEELHKELSKHDVGLALEDVRQDYNRSICLTNKILAYYQSGLFIVATDTPAQRDFLLKRKLHGTITGTSANEMSATLSKLYEQKVMLRQNAEIRYSSASAECWETEAEKVSELWSDLK